MPNGSVIRASRRSAKSWGRRGHAPNQLRDCPANHKFMFRMNNSRFRRCRFLCDTQLDSQLLTNSLRRTVAEIDKDVPVYRTRTLVDYMAGSIAQPRLNAILVGLFAGIALLLATAGIFGVMSYSVTQRTHEIGIRLLSARNVATSSASSSAGHAFRWCWSAPWFDRRVSPHASASKSALRYRRVLIR